jgi:hypothetical protein
MADTSEATLDTSDADEEAEDSIDETLDRVVIVDIVWMRGGRLCCCGA